MQVTIAVREQQVEDVEANHGTIAEQREYLKAAIYEVLSEATGGEMPGEELRYCPKDAGEVAYSITVKVDPIMEEIMESPEATPEWREQMRRIQEANLQGEVETYFFGCVYPPEVDATGWDGWVA